MRNLVRVISICLLIHLVTAPPPRRNEPAEKKQDGSQDKEEVEDFGLEYNRYLKEVIDLLESDPEFKKKLEDAQEVDIRSGQIAKELEFVDHKVRSKLDEVKRQEIERLRHLAQKQYELSNGIETEHVKVSSEHLDHENPHTFEMEDLKKLIAKVSADLSEADEKRRQEFKEYEMQKEFEKQQKLKHLEGSEKEAFERQLKENETKHKQHEPLHHPGSKQQLEEVWEKQDHMDSQDFDPKIFFQLHDLDGNGFWDHNEVKTLFLKELDKMYQAGAPEDDMKERFEEMERMREHVFSEADRNKDGLISYAEFIDKTKQPDFEKDPGWETLDQKPVFTQEEYREFERRREEEIQRMIQQRMIQPQPVFHHDPGYLQVQYAEYQAGGHQYPQGQQLSHRYAQEFPNPSFQQAQGHPNQPHQAFSNAPVANQHYQNPQGAQHLGHQQAQGYQHPQGQQQHQAYQQPQSIQNQPQHSNQPHQNQNPPQGYQQSQQNLNPPQGYQQPQQNQNQPQGYQQPQQNQNQPQQNHNQPQGYQQPQQNQNQPRGYQQPQQNQNQPQGYQQLQQNQNQPQGYQQPRQNQAPLSNSNPPAPSQNQQPSPQTYQPGHDPNEIHPQQPDPKYSKDNINSHPNVIDSQQKKTDVNEYQPKMSNQ